MKRNDVNEIHEVKVKMEFELLAVRCVFIKMMFSDLEEPG